MAPHSSTLAWKIPWTEEPGGLQSMRSRRVGHDWSDLAAAACITLCNPMEWEKYNWSVRKRVLSLKPEFRLSSMPTTRHFPWQDSVIITKHSISLVPVPRNKFYIYSQPVKTWLKKEGLKKWLKMSVEKIIYFLSISSVSLIIPFIQNHYL